MLCFEGTHSVSGELWGVVVDVGDPDDGGGGVGEAVHWASLHIRSLEDQGVLGDFLEQKRMNQTL